jgi:hypothetical protein
MELATDIHGISGGRPLLQMPRNPDSWLTDAQSGWMSNDQLVVLK